MSTQQPGVQTIGDALKNVVPLATPVSPQPTQQTPLPPPQDQVKQPKKGPTPVEMKTGLDLSPYLKLFIFGDAGSGKTLFAATAPKPLFLDTENSTETLRDWPEIAAQCKIINPFKWRHVDPFLHALRNTDQFKDRETIVLDTVDSEQRDNLGAVLRGSGRDPYLPMEHDYKKSGEMIRRFLLELRDLEMHVIVLCHSEEVISDAGNLTTIRPGCTPKLAKTLREEFSLTGYLATTMEKFDDPFSNVLQTRSNAYVKLKSRYRHLPPLLHNPTFRDIWIAANKYKEQEQ